MLNKPGKLIPLHGGYRKLKSFQVAQLIYDVTVWFCERHRRDIFVESKIKENSAPSGAAYSVRLMVSLLTELDLSGIIELQRCQP
jgi:hypothetical protein